MVQAEKLFERMRHHFLDWRIEDLQAVAKRHHVSWNQPGTSHVTFRAPDGGKVTVPSRKPIKPVYVRQFVALLNTIKGLKDV